MSGYEIRECTNTLCRMRYPLVDSQRFGLRCPACRGETHAVIVKRFDENPGVEEAPEHMILEGFLDNIRSAWNVGSIMRSADGVGVRKLSITGLTPLPDNPKVIKTALGAEKTVAWSYFRNGLEAANELRRQGHCLIALEVDHRSKSIIEPMELNPSRTQVLIVGNEVTGVDPGILDICEYIVSLPMVGSKHSYNVAVAFSIAAFMLVYQRNWNGLGSCL